MLSSTLRINTVIFTYDMGHPTKRLQNDGKGLISRLQTKQTFCMKKVLLFIFASLMFATSATYATAQTVNPPKRKQEQIPIRDQTPPPTPPMTLSAMATVEACYTPDLALLELWFNREVGVVTVRLKDNMTGYTLVQYTCNSSLEPQVCLNIALDAGFYTLQIIGSDYEGSGDFDL